MNLDHRTARAYKEAMTDFEQRMRSFNEKSLHISRRTTLMIRAFYGLALLVMLYGIYFTYEISTEAEQLAGAMAHMYEYFGVMAEDMQVMAGSVENIGNNVSGIPLIAQSMVQMSADMSRMTDHVQQMEGDVSRMDRNMSTITVNVRDMTNRLGAMNHNVDYMRHNIDQMSTPMRTFNTITP